MNVTVYRIRMNRDRLIKHLRDDHGWGVPKSTSAADAGDEHRGIHALRGRNVNHEHVK